MLAFQEISRTTVTKMQDVAKQLSCLSLNTPVPCFLLEKERERENDTEFLWRGLEVLTQCAPSRRYLISDMYYVSIPLCYCH